MKRIYYDDQGYPIPPQLVVEPKTKAIGLEQVILGIMVLISVIYLAYRIITFLAACQGVL